MLPAALLALGGFTLAPPAHAEPAFVPLGQHDLDIMTQLATTYGWAAAFGWDMTPTPMNPDPTNPCPAHGCIAVYRAHSEDEDDFASRH